MRRGIRYPQWFLLLVAILGILRDCRSSLDSNVLPVGTARPSTWHLGLDLKRWPTDATFLHLFNKAHMREYCFAEAVGYGQVLQGWMLAQIPGGAEALDQLVCVALGLPRSGWEVPARFCC